MLYRRTKKSKYWYADYTDATGKRIRCSTGTAVRAEAEALLNKWKLAAFNEKQWGIQPAYTFDDLMLKYLPATSEKRSHERDLISAEHLQSFFEGRELASIGPGDITGYIETRKAKGRASATINRELGLLSSAIGYARKALGWQIENPVSGRRLAEPEGRVRWIKRGEANSLIAASRTLLRAPHLPSFIVLSLNTGCRRGELLNLEWDRVDFENGLIHLEAKHTKSNRRRSVPLNDDALGALQTLNAFRKQYCSQSNWVFCRRNGTRIASVKTAFRKARELAGIQDFRIHDQRHTTASWAVNDGADLYVVRQLLGHASVKTTERYAHLAPHRVREMVSLLGQHGKDGTFPAHPGNDEGAGSQDPV